MTVKRVRTTLTTLYAVFWVAFLIVLFLVSTPLFSLGQRGALLGWAVVLGVVVLVSCVIMQASLIGKLDGAVALAYWLLSVSVLVGTVVLFAFFLMMGLGVT